MIRSFFIIMLIACVPYSGFAQSKFYSFPERSSGGGAKTMAIIHTLLNENSDRVSEIAANAASLSELRSDVEGKFAEKAECEDAGMLFGAGHSQANGSGCIPSLQIQPDGNVRAANSGVTLGNATACNSSSAGTLRYVSSSKSLEYCDGTSWVSLKPSFGWYASNWSACGTSCGTGTQTRTVECRNAGGLGVSESYCGDSTKPAATQACSSVSGCSYSWTYSSWGICGASPYWGSWSGWSSCSASCGGGTMSRSRTCLNSSGTQTRTAQCRRSDGTIVADSYCAGSPTLSQSCTVNCVGSGVESQSCNTHSCGPVCTTYSNPSRIGLPVAQSSVATAQFCVEQLGSGAYANSQSNAFVGGTVARYKNCSPPASSWCSYTGPDTYRATSIQCCK